MEFTHDSEARLISLIEERRYLWHSKDPLYHSKQAKENGFREIMDQLGEGFSETMIKSKWANLRSQFQREVRKIKDSTQGAGFPLEAYTPRWAHFQRMQFLRQSSGDEVHTVEASCPLPVIEIVHENSMDHIPETKEHETSQAGPPGHTPSGFLRKRALIDGSNGAGSSSSLSCKRPREVTPETSAPSKAPSMDQCRAFGLMMENSVREIPDGPNRDLAILVAYQALVRYKLTINGHSSDTVDITLSELFRS